MPLLVHDTKIPLETINLMTHEGGQIMWVIIGYVSFNLYSAKRNKKPQSPSNVPRGYQQWSSTGYLQNHFVQDAPNQKTPNLDNYPNPKPRAQVTPMIQASFHMCFVLGGFRGPERILRHEKRVHVNKRYVCRRM